MARSSAPSRSRAFLLRLWEERSTQPPHRVWRCSLESAQSHERRGFDSPEALAAYLHTVFDEMAHAEDEREGIGHGRDP